MDWKVASLLGEHVIAACLRTLQSSVGPRWNSGLARCVCVNSFVFACVSVLQRRLGRCPPWFACLV